MRSKCTPLFVALITFTFLMGQVANGAPQESPRKVVLISDDVDDTEVIINSLEGEYEIQTFSREETPNEVLSTLISKRFSEKISEILVFSHGTEGAFDFGNTTINNENVNQFASVFYPLILKLTTDATFQIYSCQTGSGEIGQQLVNRLAKITRSFVFASSNMTGIDGDWVLEVNSQNSSLLKEVSIVNYSKNLQTVNEGGYAIRTFASPGMGIVSEMAIDVNNGDIYFTVGETDGPMHRYDLLGNLETLGEDWTGTNWHPYAATDIELWNGSIYSNLIEQIVSFDPVTLTNSYIDGLTSAEETGSAIVGDILWTTSGRTADTYYRINLVSNTIEASYPIQYESYMEGLEYCANTNKLYIMTDSYGIRELYMDGTGAGPVIGGSAGSIGNFAIDPEGDYAYYMSEMGVYQVNLQTGSESLFAEGLGSDIACDLEFGPSAAVPGKYSLYIGSRDQILEVYETITTDPVSVPFSCDEQSIEIGFTAETYNEGNVFTAQLSDATGSFDTPVVMGSIEATTSDIMTATMPVVPYGTLYRIRVVSSDPAHIGADNGEDLTLGENVPPVLTVQNLTIELDAAGSVSIAVLDVVTSASDNCTIADTVLSQSTFDCVDLGLVSVDVTLTDVFGNSTVETIEVTVEDNIAPSLTVQNITAELDGAGSVTITALDVVTSSSDNCTIADTVLSQSTFDCADIGLVSIDVTLTDVFGNSTVETIEVTVEDNIAPSLTVQNITAELDGTGNVTITALDVVTSASDNCTIADTVLSRSTFDCADIGLVSVDVTLTDVFGNSTVETMQVTVEDNIAPSLVVQNISVELDAAGSGSIAVLDVVTSASDNCTIADTVLSQSTFDCADIGLVSVDVTLTDVFGNSTVETMQVTVEDNIAPSLSVQNIIAELDGTGNVTITALDVVTSAGDNCTIADTVLNQSTFDCADIGLVSVDVTLTDVFGNSTVETIEVTVEDNIAPSLTVQNITAEVDGTGSVTITALDVVTSAGDNCTIADTVLSRSTFDCADIGLVSVDVTLTDVFGNSTVETMQVTVEDNIAPSLSVQNITAEMDGTGGVTITALDVVTSAGDNCMIADTVLSRSIFDCADQGTVSVDVTLTDISGNSVLETVEVTVIDGGSPVGDATSLLELTDECLVAAPAAPTATDACAGVITGTSDVTFPVTTQGLTVITWTYDDGNGNTSTQTQNIVIDDITAPTATCVGDLTICEADAAQIALVDANDDCGTISISYELTGATSATGNDDASSELFNEGVTTVTYTVDDGNGNNFQCSFTVTYAPVGDVIITEAEGVLSVSNEGTYQWINCEDNSTIEGETSSTFTPTKNGSYAVTVNNGSCEFTSNCFAFVISGFHANQLESSFRAYPNPTASMLTIDLGQECSDVKISILSINGQVVMVKEFDEMAQTELNLSNLIEGVYLVLVSSNQGTSNTRIIKK